MHRKRKDRGSMVHERKNVKLTAEAIQERLGFSTIAMPADVAIGARQMAMIREAGITRIEICGLHPPTHYDYHNRTQVQEIMDECRTQGIRIVAVHGPGVPYDTPYEAVRRGAVEEVVASARVAEEMGAAVFVAHFNTNEHAERTVREVIERLDDADLMLAIENLPGAPDLRECRAFVDRIGCEKFGIAIDIGHPRDLDGVNPFVKEGRARETIALCEDRIVHLHLHDFVERDHYPPFDGDVRWDETFEGLQDIGYTGEFMFEAVAPVSVADTLRKTVAFPDEFVARYGHHHPAIEST
jgi:sugar phosphate isomerase/epimerase